MSVSVHADPDGDFGVTVTTPATVAHLDDLTATDMPVEYFTTTIPGLTVADMANIRKAGLLCTEQMQANISARVFCHVARLAGFAWHNF